MLARSSHSISSRPTVTAQKVTGRCTHLKTIEAISSKHPPRTRYKRPTTQRDQRATGSHRVRGSASESKGLGDSDGKQGTWAKRLSVARCVIPPLIDKSNLTIVMGTYSMGYPTNYSGSTPVHRTNRCRPNLSRSNSSGISSMAIRVFGSLDLLLGTISPGGLLC